MSDSFSNDSGFDISKIAGNCSEETKQLLGNIRTFLRFGGKEGTTQFGDAIQSRLRVTEMTVNKKVEEENKLEAKVVMEIEVQEGTCLVHKFWPELFYTVEIDQSRYTDKRNILYIQICSTQEAMFTGDARLSWSMCK